MTLEPSNSRCSRRCGVFREPGTVDELTERVTLQRLASRLRRLWGRVHTGNEPCPIHARLVVRCARAHAGRPVGPTGQQVHASSQRSGPLLLCVSDLVTSESVIGAAISRAQAY